MAKLSRTFLGLGLSASLAFTCAGPAAAAPISTQDIEAPTEADRPVVLALQQPSTVIPGEKFTVDVTIMGNGSPARNIELSTPSDGIPGTYSREDNNALKYNADGSISRSFTFYVQDIPYGSYGGYEIWASDENDTYLLETSPKIAVDDPAHPVAAVPAITGKLRVGNTIHASIEAAAGSQTVYRWTSRHLYESGSSVVLDKDTYGQPLTLLAETIFPDGVKRLRTLVTAPVGLGKLTPKKPTISLAQFGSVTQGAYERANSMFVWEGKAETTATWLLDGEEITGANGDTYRPRLADIGKTLQLKVVSRAISPIYETTPEIKISAGKKIAQGTLKAGSPKIVSPTPNSKEIYVKQKLKAKPGQWTSGTKLAYQWLLNGKHSKGATASTFIPPFSAQDKKISVKVTGKLSGYKTRSVTSAAVTAKLRTLTKPVLYTTGTRKVGKIQKASYDPDLGPSWTKGTSVSFQWYRSGKKIKGATQRAYKTVKADRGKTLQVWATGKKPGYKTATLKYSLRIK